MSHPQRIGVVLAGVALACASCSRSDNEEPPAAQAPEPTQTSGAEHNDVIRTAPAIQEPTPAVSPGMATPASNPTASEHATATPPNQDSTAPVADEQIVRILSTIDSGEIEQAQLAQHKAKDARVKKFANQMVDQHTKSKQKGLQLAKKQQLFSANSSIANDLADNSLQLVNSLRNFEGADFDKAYIDAQVEQHQAGLDLLNSRLIPSASNVALKAELQDAKKMVELHLAHAKGIQAQPQR